MHVHLPNGRYVRVVLSLISKTKARKKQSKFAALYVLRIVCYAMRIMYYASRFDGEFVRKLWRNVLVRQTNRNVRDEKESPQRLVTQPSERGRAMPSSMAIHAPQNG